MGIHITWANDEKTIICHTYDAEWTVTDYYHLIDRHVKELATVSHTVDIINDLRNVATVPESILSAIRHAIRVAPLNEGINVMVGATMLIQMLVGSANISVKGETPSLIQTSTLEEAFAIIQKERAKRQQARL